MKKYNFALLLVFLQFEASWATPENTLRLVGGLTPSDGRLEIFHSNQWGTICDDSWDHAEATIACRQLGYTAVTTNLYSVSNGPGMGSGSIFLDDVQCMGNEGRLVECLHSGWGVHNCNHGEDVAIRCGYDNPYVDPMPIRLSGGSSRSGLLEVYLDHTWGTVCHGYWDLMDAQVACRQLGFTSVADFYYTPPVIMESSVQIHVYFVGCEGSEDYLSQCVRRDSWATRNCHHDEDVAIVCDSSPSMEYSLRLADGPHPYEGRLEVISGSEWGTVCDDYWDGQDADVACRQMGFGPPVPLSVFGIPQGSGAILLDDVMCDGWELRLFDCGHLAFGSHNCVHNEDVFMACSADLTGTQVSQDIQVPDDYTFHLVDGRSHYEGRLELDYNGVSGGVCDVEWTVQDAAVVCRQLGFGTAIRGVPNGVFGWNPHGYYWMNNVTCAGDETTLRDCSIGSLGQLQFCGLEWQDVGVACTGPYPGDAFEVHNAAVRLEGGSHPGEGRVEILFNGEWSTVCDDDWDVNDADVVCAQLGYHHSLNTYHYIDWLPPASGPILLDGVRCQGYESTIMECRHNGLYTHDCVHDEDVVIECQFEAGSFSFQLGGVRIFAIIASVSTVIFVSLFVIKRRMQLQRQRQLVVVPDGDRGPTGFPGQHPPLKPYPTQQTTMFIPHQQHIPPLNFTNQQFGPPPLPPSNQPPYASTTVGPPLPPLGYPDPNPIPPSYVMAAQGADGINQLPVYIPSPVATRLSPRNTMLPQPPQNQPLNQTQGMAPMPRPS